MSQQEEEQQSKFELGLQVRPFNARMRQARLRAGFTQAELGLLVGKHQGEIGAIELLKMTPDTDLAYDIADALQEPIELLFPDWLREAKLAARFSRDAVFSISSQDALEAPAELQALQQEIRAQVALLRPREAKVLALRFGLGGHERATRDKVGKQFGVTAERICQIEDRALRKLRRSRCSKRLKPFLE